MTYSSQMVDIIYPIQIYIFENVYSPTLCPKGTQKPCNLHSSSKCWHDISNINIYLQATYTPQIVGIIYPIQIYISENVHSPNLYPKDIHKPCNLHSSSKCWHDISIINIYLQATYVNSRTHEELHDIWHFKSWDDGMNYNWNMSGTLGTITVVTIVW